jgi:hypothetical protein
MCVRNCACLTLSVHVLMHTWRVPVCCARSLINQRVRHGFELCQQHRWHRWRSDCPRCVTTTASVRRFAVRLNIPSHRDAVCTGASATLLLSGGVITGCSSAGTGGGVFLDAGAASNMSDVTLNTNSAGALGGGVYASSSATLCAVNVTWTSNAASSGGGLVVGALATASVASSTFSSNLASSSAGALLASSAASVALTSCVFYGNAAAGLAPHGGAVSMENTALVAIAGCMFDSNAVSVDTLQATVGTVAQLAYAGANTGGALFLGAAPAAAGGVPMTATITNTQFVGCNASGSGGALAALGQTSMISLSIGGATAFSANNAAVSGGALALSGSVTTIVAGTVIFNGNAAQQDGGAAALSDGSSSTFGGATFTANVAAGSGGALFLQGTAAAASTTVSGGAAFTSNSALYGGAVALSGPMHALTVSGAAAFSANNASYGGVFALSQVMANSSQLSLSGATLTGNTGDIGALFFSDMVVARPACAGCVLAGNSASNYGAVSASNQQGIATPPQTFTVAPATPAVVSGSPFTLLLAMQDGYLSQVAFWPGFRATISQQAALSGVLGSGTLESGAANVSTAYLSGSPGSVMTLTVVLKSPTLTGGASQSLMQNVIIAQCEPNQVYDPVAQMCLCDRGYISDGASLCTSCAAGTFAPGIGETACTACAAKEVSLNASAACVVCPHASRPYTDSICMCENGYYGVFADTNNGKCKLCPDNAICQFGMIAAAPGFWRSSSNSTDIQPCPEEEACDFPNRSSTLISLALSGVDEATLREAQCWPAYEGTLCAVCADGFGRDTDLKCGECPSFDENTGKLALTSFTNILSVAITIRAAGHTTGAPLHSQIIKIFLNYLTVTSLASRAPLKWPKRIEELLAAQSTGTHSGGKTVAIECSLPTYGDRPKFYDLVSGYLVLMPVTAIACCLLWLAIYTCISRPAAVAQACLDQFSVWWDAVHAGAACPLPYIKGAAVESGAAAPPPAEEQAPRGSFAFIGSDDVFSSSPPPEDVGPPPLRKEDAKYEAHLTAILTKPHLGHDLASARNMMVNYVIISLVCTTFFLWTPVSSAILHLFVCVEVDPDTPESPLHGLYLQQSSGELCWQGRHLRYMLGGGLTGLLFVVLGIPIGNGLFLWFNRRSLDDPVMRLRYGFTYFGYRHEACYYESVIMMRKLALVVRACFLHA